MKFSTAMLFGLALIVGVAVGYMFNPSVDMPDPAVKHVKAPGSIKDGGDAASLAALRARIAELEALLEKSGKGIEIALKEKGEGNDAEKRDRRGPFGGMSRREWREKMKKENPQEYAKMTNGMARWRSERLARAQRKVDFLSSIDVSKMSASARKVHTELQDLLAKREELEQKMHEMHESDVEYSREDMEPVFREMRDTSDRIRELNAQERDNLMVETAKNLGFNEDEATEVSEAFQEIIENTEGGFGATGRPHGGQDGSGGNPGGNAPGGNSAPPPPGM